MSGQRQIVLRLTQAQAKALQALVGFAQGACEDEPNFIRLYRTPAAERASQALDAAISDTKDGGGERG